MSLTMLENGLEFIIDSVKKLKSLEKHNCNNEISKVKYSLLHLSSGIELILKHRLYIEHWTYIFSDMNKASKDALNDGSFQSIEYSKSIERLERLCSITIEKKDKEAFENLRKCRNQMEHFTIKVNITYITACTNKALTAITNFITNNYSDFSEPPITAPDDVSSGLTKNESELINMLIKETSKLKEHYDDALKVARAKAENETLLDELVNCPLCKESMLKCGYTDKGECYCFFCSYIENGTKAVKQYLNEIEHLCEYEIIKDGGEYPLYCCPDCFEESFIFANGEYKCFSCGIYYNEDEIKKCNECGALYTILSSDDLGLCGDCIEYKSNI